MYKKPLGLLVVNKKMERTYICNCSLKKNTLVLRSKFYAKKTFTFTVGNIYIENSSLLTRFWMS